MLPFCSDTQNRQQNRYVYRFVEAKSWIWSWWMMQHRVDPAIPHFCFMGMKFFPTMLVHAEGLFEM